jgi:hypothetical protein
MYTERAKVAFQQKERNVFTLLVKEKDTPLWIKYGLTDGNFLCTLKLCPDSSWLIKPMVAAKQGVLGPRCNVRQCSIVTVLGCLLKFKYFLLLSQILPKQEEIIQGIQCGQWIKDLVQLTRWLRLTKQRSSVK